MVEFGRYDRTVADCGKSRFGLIVSEMKFANRPSGPDPESSLFVLDFLSHENEGFWTETCFDL
jgi:hypothetical protein